MIYFLPYLIMALGAKGLYQGQATWAGFVILFVIFPIVELLFRNSKMQKRPAYADYSVILMPFALSLLLSLSLWSAKSMTSGIQLAGLIFSTGALLGGFGITSAHELVHRRASWQRALGVYNLTLVNFAYWGVEHVFGHHRNVSTPEDSATALKDELVYSFWLRNYSGLLKSSYKIAPKKFLSYWLISLLASALIIIFLGTKLLLVWFGISIVAILLLLTVDYIEHYGLVRGKNQTGTYLAFKAEHSWDTDSPLTNLVLFNLGYHSHHHLRASLPFLQLEANDQAKKMPFGYSVMILCALMPPVFFKIMNHKI